MSRNNNEEIKNLREEKISRKEIFNGAIVHLTLDSVKLPDGNTATREVAWHKGAVCVVPLTESGEIILERQFRYPFDDVITEIPAGKMDKTEENPEEAARRELLEETGYTAKEMIFIGCYYPSPAILSEKIYMYVAKGLKKHKQKLDEDEFLEVFSVPFEEAVNLILENSIPDGKTQTAVLKAYNLMLKGDLHIN